MIGSAVSWPSRFSNVSGAVVDLPENPEYHILLILRQVPSSHVNIYEIRMHFVVGEYMVR